MIELVPLSQRNKDWGNKLLGFNTNSKYTIHSYGCLITCLAMAANWYGKRTDPKKLNKKLKEISGFVNGGYYVWNSLTRIYPEIIEKRRITSKKLTNKQMQEIFGWLDKGYPVMLHIDMFPETAPCDMHFVLAVGYNKDDENDIQIADPWTGSIRSLYDYLKSFKKTARGTIEQYIGLVSTPPSSFNDGNSEPSDISTLQDEVKALELKLEVLGGELVDLRKSRDKWRNKHRKDSETCAKEVKDLADQRDKCQKDYSELYSSYEEETQSYFQQIEELKNTIAGLRIIHEEGGIHMKTFYDKLPKMVKVFGFIALSTVLSELAIELGSFDQTFLVRISAQLINLVLVAVEQGAPAIKARLNNKK